MTPRLLLFPYSAPSRAPMCLYWCIVVIAAQINVFAVIALFWRVNAIVRWI